MKKGLKRILSIVLSLAMVFTSVSIQQSTTKADDITWTKLSNMSIYETYAYLNQADIDAGKFGNEGLRNFYDPGKGQGWNLADGSDMKDNIPYFGFVTTGANATGLTIDGVEYPSDGQKVVIAADTVYINQDLLKLQDNEDEHIFEINAVGSNTQFQLRIKRETAPDVTFDEVKEWKQVPGTATNGDAYYVSTDVYNTISNNNALIGLYDTHTAAPYHPVSCTITGPVYVTAVIPVKDQMKAVWVDGVKYPSGTDVCYLDGDQCHLAQSLFTLPEGETSHTFKIIVQGNTTNCAYLMKVTSLSAPTKLSVYNYGKYTGKYFVEFMDSKNAASYNIYVDNTLIKNVKTSGNYLTSEELEAAGIAKGDHTLSVTAVDANGGESIQTSTSIKVEAKGTADDIPQIYISTHGKNVDGTYLSKKDDFLANANVAVIDNTGTYKDIIDAASDIKVRGNSTAGAEKKPWNFKLSKKQSVLGMDSSKKWSLLANAYDKSLLRNSLVMQLAAKMGLAYTSSCRFVDVYLNGEYKGNYVFIESVETGTGRVEIDANNVASNDILLELDNNGRDAAEVAHLERTGLGVLLAMNEPEIAPDDTEELATYKNKIDATQQLLDDFETALKANDYDAMSKYIDMESFAKFYIVNEFFRNQDFNFSSTRFYVKDGILYAGPCWDYDLSSGNLGTYYVPDGKDTYNSFLAQEMVWYTYLMKNNQFKDLVSSIYKEYQSDIRALFDGSRADQGYGIDGFEKLYRNSFERNYASKENLGAGWSVTNPDQADAYSYANHKSWNTYDDAVEFLRTWLRKRHVWLEEQWGVDDTSLPASIVNSDGKVMIRWNNETGVTADHYKITYDKFTAWNSDTYTATTESTNITATADLTQTEITDPIAAGTDVVVYAVDSEGNETKVGTAVAKPDLIVSDLYLDNAPVLAGASAHFKMSVSNIGTAVAYPTDDVVATTLSVDGTQVAYTVGYKDAILPNATESDYGFQMNWTATAGSHKVTANIDDRNKVDESNESNNTLTKTFVIDNTTEDSKITGYQISTTLTIDGVENQIGIRTIYQTEDLVNGQSVKEFGLIIGLTNHLTDVENEMIANGTNKYVITNAATSAGQMDTQMGDSATATYYARTMDIAGGYDVDYSVRTYAKLADGSIAYSEVKTVNVYKVAKELYDNGKMQNYTAHETLYNDIISKVDGSSSKVDYNWNNTLVNKPEQIGGSVKVEGYQMTASLGNVSGKLGLRIVYSVEGNYDEVGLVYGLVYGDNPITAADMTVDSESKYVKAYAATKSGKLNAKLGASNTASYYARTMNVTGLNKAGYTVSYMVRAYAKASDGTITYSDVYTYNVNDVASVLYDNDLMSTFDGHNAIYNNILTKVDENYKAVDYNWSNAMVK